MTSRRYTVRVTKDELVFSAGHFITFNGDECERIHGHNWRVAVEVDGPLDENHYVFDFIALRDLTRALVAELDHRMLLPDRNPHIRVGVEGRNVVCRHRDRLWSFPAEECVILPIENTTAERIADHLGDRLRAAIASRGMPFPRAMRVSVEENFGQWATAHWDAEEDGG
ncbi:6-pyruvoyl trahydropterin synthase family protein [Tautonia sociabilis]|uniref:6-carboxy-5,6,7,8-tetrahydropterin synthase n=1 Tax=Tautonia sociabilis TaxID=2080755 RepID=A0A432MEY8_9BACT|nr:6-pyruvoyl tetrahydropterin synthase family protein [Tautonia sociabilis]RUL84318.1 6-pyruvoyl tetrahydropterin synthase family protein [Tautonia sociabilis]